MVSNRIINILQPRSKLRTVEYVNSSYKFNPKNCKI